jgi:hypothetical protein
MYLVGSLEAQSLRRPAGERARDFWGCPEAIVASLYRFAPRARHVLPTPFSPLNRLSGLNDSNPDGHRGSFSAEPVVTGLFHLADGPDRQTDRQTDRQIAAVSERQT